MSQRTNIDVAYGGPALDEGTMDVRDLAPALFALGELLSEANSVLNGDGSTLSVRVRSDFETGSFEIYLELIQSLSDQVSMWLGRGGKPLTPEEIAQLIGLSSGSCVSLIAVIKHLKNRKISKVVEHEGGSVTVESIDEESSSRISIEMPGFTFKLFKSRRIRKSLAGVVAPLRQNGIDYFEARVNQRPVETVVAEEVSSFDEPPLTEELLVDVERRGAFQILSTSFDDDLKWRVSDGVSRFPVTMGDERFQKQIEDGRPFSKGDTLVARVRTVQKRNSEGALSTEHTIEEVVRHIRKEEQIPLPLPDVDADEDF